MPEKTNAAEEVVVDISVQDAYGGVEVRYGLDSGDLGAWLPADSEFAVDVSGLADGSYTVYVEARNAPGLMSEVEEAVFELDRTAPTITITTPKDGARITNDGLGFDWDASAFDDGGIVLQEYRIDDGEWTSELPDELPNYGKHTIYVRVVDEAGNEAIVSTTFTIKEESPGPSLVLALAALSIALVLVRRRR